MATALDALLRIKAQVTGAPAVQALGGAIGGVQKSATSAMGALQRMSTASGGLGGALGALTPLLSAAGLGAMAKGAIDAADNLNDLSQKTGVSVEALSQFNTAAQMSGTTIEGVSGAMVKLNRNLATRNDKATAALTSLGISATDASGKLKSADQVMLEVANKFSRMEDGAKKSAAAQALFGKSGADMIPMLNMGGDAIRKLGVTMSGEFAQKADALNDKMAVLQAKFTSVAVSVAASLMPALEGLANVVGGIADAFLKLPEPIQALIGGLAVLAVAFVVLAPAITAIVSIAGVLGPALAGIGTILAGLGTVFAVVGSAIAAFVTWPVLLVAAVVAAGVAIFVFRDQIGAFFQQVAQMAVDGWNALIAPLQPTLDAIGQAMAAGWAAIAEAAYNLFVQPWVALWKGLKPYVTALWDFVKGVCETAWSALIEIGYKLFVAPWVALWKGLKVAVTGLWEWLKPTASAAWSSLTALGNKLFVQPWVDLWEKVLRKPVTEAWTWLQETWSKIATFFKKKVTDPVSAAWNGMISSIKGAWQAFSGFIPKVIETAVGKVKDIFNGIIQGIAKGINAVVRELNKLLRDYNSAARAAGNVAPQIKLLPQLDIPALAQGGVTRSPTLALIGEGGEPEYVIPESKMGRASANYLSGARGGAVIPAFAEGGFVGSIQERSIFGNDLKPWNRSIFGDGLKPWQKSIYLTIKTGTVVNMNGENYITMADFERGMMATAEGVLDQLRSPTVKSSLGLS